MIQLIAIIVIVSETINSLSSQFINWSQLLSITISKQFNFSISANYSDNTWLNIGELNKKTLLIVILFSYHKILSSSAKTTGTIETFCLQHNNKRKWQSENAYNTIS